MLLTLILLVFASGVSAQDKHADPSLLEFSKWSDEINVPDPVAISFDNRGTAYVTQTQRRKAQDLDIRRNQDWITNDVSFQSVEDKVRFYHEQLAPGSMQEKNRLRVEDLNGDGSHDYRDLMVISEKIHWLRDSDGDGKADESGLFAEDFKTEVTGIAAGVLSHQGNVYTTIAPDVWKLKDIDGDNKADQREKLATGFGLHIAYAGHDMHGLTVGPDGKIYWSIGDKGISAKSKDGTRFHYPNQGGVMRCDPNGENFEVFAHGLRNVQELAFDAFGNLFGVDNDSDQPGEKERFVYIVQNMDAGWRCNYQYRGDGYNPWTAEKLWVPHFDGQASYILPAIQNYVDGPAGFVFNPGTALSTEYLDHFFLTNAPRGLQYAFRVKPDGASFLMHGEHKIAEGTALVGLNFGPDGALYGVDWGGGYPLNQSGAVWKIDVPDSDLTTERKEVSTILRDGFESLSTKSLKSQLSHRDQRVRLGAQFELVNREEQKVFAETLESSHQLARVHCAWGLGQLARSGDKNAKEMLESLLKDKDPEIRAQATRTLTSVANVNGDLFVDLLADTNERCVFMAAQALNKHPSSVALNKLISISNDLSESDRYMRFAVTQALAACGNGDQLLNASRNASVVGRLNLAVALRGHHDWQALESFLSDKNAQVATEAARALHDDFSTSQQLTMLASVLSKTKHTGEQFLRRVLNANFRMGNIANLRNILDFAAKTTAPEDLRLETLAMLENWLTPAPLDLVDGRFREFGNREIDSSYLQDILSRLLLDQSGPIQAASIRAARNLKIDLAAPALTAFLDSKTADTTLRIEALRSLASRGTTKFQSAVQKSLGDADPKMRMAAAELLAKSNPELIEQRLIEIASSKSSLAERQHAISLLGKLSRKNADQFLTSLLESVIASKLETKLTLDVIEASTLRAKENTRLADLLAKADEAILNTANKTLTQDVASFSICRDGGSVEAGEKLFRTHLSAQCIRCHRVSKKGSNIGPDLRGIAKKRDRDYLLRSILLPSADIDKKYQSRSFVMSSGKMIQGMIKEETDDAVVVINNEGKELRLDVDEIEAEKANTVSIMPKMTDALTRREIRDLVAYLGSLGEEQDQKK